MTGREAVLAVVNLSAHAHPPCDVLTCVVCTAREYLRTTWPAEYQAFHDGVAEMYRAD